MSTEQHDIYFASPTYLAIEEGLTEYITTRICNSLINKSQGNTQYIFNRRDAIAYHTEVYIIDKLVEFGELDPLELFETAKTHQELIKLIEPKQHKFLELQLKEAGFSAKTIDTYLRIAEEMANKAQKLVIALPQVSKENPTKFINLLIRAKNAFRETNNVDSVSHREIDITFEEYKEDMENLAAQSEPSGIKRRFKIG